MGDTKTLTTLKILIIGESSVGKSRYANGMKWLTDGR